MSFLLHNASLILEPARGVVRGWVLIERGIIKGLGTGDWVVSRDIPMLDCGGDFVGPGLIDLHVHGALGSDTMEASEEAFGTILRAHAKRGTTTAVLTTVAAQVASILAVLERSGNWVNRPGCAKLAGIHLEGPWFSRRRCGAHDPAQLRNPGVAEIVSLLAYRYVIRRVTLAPELPGSIEAIRTFRDAGIAVSAGHSDASEEESLKGFDSGVTQVTHLHNAMSSLGKTNPPRRGLAEAALETKGILCELIADGVHVTPGLLREAYERKGWQNLALVSDATAGFGLPRGGVFRLGDLECRVEEKAVWTGKGIARCLAGSSAPLFLGIRTMVEGAGVSIAEAVGMASLVPARSLGLEERIGSLEVGKSGDLIRFSSEWELRGVWIEGEQILQG